MTPNERKASSVTTVGYGTPQTEIHKGMRVELHPGLDLWMQGARYGEVKTEPDNKHLQGLAHCQVKLDKVRKPMWFDVRDLTPV